MKQKTAKEARTSIIDAIRTPLGFFALISLIVEAGLGILVFSLTDGAQLIALYGMIGTLVLLILVVGFIGYHRPLSLAFTEQAATSMKNAGADSFLQHINAINDKLSTLEKNLSDRLDGLDIHMDSEPCQPSTYTWPEVDVACNELYKTIMSDDYVPDILIGIGRGGVIAAGLLACHFREDPSPSHKLIPIAV